MATYSIDKIKYGDNVYSLIDNTSGYTKNTGTVTGVKVNGSTKSPSSGIVDIGTVITAHQDISGKANAATTLSGYGITDAYTKTEIDNKISGVLHYKGTKATVADVTGLTGMAIGDVWHVTANGAEYAYDGTTWQELGTAVDLSNYVTTSDSRLSDARTPTSHTHGNITNAGDITATAPTIANNDCIVINDDSASKITNGPAFDGSTTTKALTPKGTWETFLQSHQSLAGYVPTSRTINSKALTANITLSASDVGAAASDHTHATTIATSTATNQITLAHGSKYAITAGGTSYVFTMPSAQSIPTSAANATTGISVADHSTTSITGVSGSTTVRGVKTGTSSTITASKASGGNGTAASWTFEEKTIPNVTAVGSGSYTQGSFSGGSLTMAIDGTDNNQLNITFTAATHGSDSHTHTAPTLGTAIKVQSKSGGSNGSASTWSFTDVTVPIRADADTTVPTAASSATTVVTSKTHTVTDTGHTHTLS